MKQKKSNIAHSVRARLMRISQERNEDYQLILIRYALERFLYRLQHSDFSEAFTLKGAFLLMLWTKQYIRSTRDMDFLANTSNDSEYIRRIFKEICEVEVNPDGLVFNVENITTEDIIEGSTYQGIRVKLIAFLEKIRIPLQFDIGFGDSVYPSITKIEYPSLLDFPKPRVLAYPPESLISEKVHAMVTHGIQNSRMKDFYDIYSLIKTIAIDKVSLGKAIKATFNNRKVDIPGETPIALTDEFAFDKTKQEQWRQFIKKNDLSNAPESLITAIDEIREFLMPVFNALNDNSNFKDGVVENK